MFITQGQPVYFNQKDIDEAIKIKLAEEKTVKCECGATSIGSNRHSTWCYAKDDS
jgi:hypothetical protein